MGRPAGDQGPGAEWPSYEVRVRRSIARGQLGEGMARTRSPARTSGSLEERGCFRDRRRPILPPTTGRNAARKPEGASGEIGTSTSKAIRALKLFPQKVLTGQLN